MLAHDSTNSAHSVCIHSVCVAKEYRRKGVALGLLREYVFRLATLRGGQYHRALLISHEELILLYKKAGFELLGPSSVTHGPRPWFQMRKALKSVEGTPSATQAIPPGVFEALQRAPRSRPEGVMLSTFPNGILDVQQESNTAGESTNKYDLLCPREGCGSVLLLKQAAQWVERATAPVRFSFLIYPYLSD
jgi:guanine nucleotide exchange factor